MPIARRRYPTASGATVVVLATGKADGDLQIDLPASVLAERRRALCDLPWRWSRQVHGADLLRVGTSGATDGMPADALTSTETGIALAVHTADCAPVALIGRTHGHVALVHAGWRGLLAGVIEGAAASLRSGGESDLAAYVGPCISAAHYAFSAEDLTGLEDQYGRAVRARTGDGHLALDLRAGVRSALVGVGIRDIDISAACTAAEPDRLYSHRARAETGRQALVAWTTAPSPTSRGDRTLPAGRHTERSGDRTP